MLTALLRRKLANLPPQLLVTLSMASQIKPASHSELVSQLTQLLSLEPRVAKALARLDRALFTSDSRPFQNRPTAISQGQCMTDSFTHALVLREFSRGVKSRPVKFWDIGTGHGYLPFAAELILQETGLRHEVHGIDFHSQNISACEQLKNKLGSKAQFRRMEFGTWLEEGPQADFVTVGFQINPAEELVLRNKLDLDGTAVYPATRGSLQNLVAVTRTREGWAEQVIGATLFAKKIDSREYYKPDDEEEQPPPLCSKPASSSGKEQAAKVEEIQREARAILDKFKAEQGRAPSLKEMHALGLVRLGQESRRLSQRLKRKQ